MQINLRATTEGIKTLKEAKHFCQKRARTCYTEKSFQEVEQEPFDEQLIQNLLESGHQGPFGHFHLGFTFTNIPKALAMLLNNSGFYTTCEKSARYTQMKLPAGQKQLYDKWLKIFEQRIADEYPISQFPKLYQKWRGIPQRKLAQENARYATSVFTPTFQMDFTTSLEHLNVLMTNFKRFIENSTEDEFKLRNASLMEEFLSLDEIQKWRIPEIVDRTERGLVYFGKENPEPNHFGQTVFSYTRPMSFACFAQAHRHRILDYELISGWEKGATLGFFIPPIISSRENKGTNTLEREWIADMEHVAETDFPQAQLVMVNEAGKRANLIGKLADRNCGQSQLEIARDSSQLATLYAQHVKEMEKYATASCQFRGKCQKGGCILGPQHYATRKI